MNAERKHELISLGLQPKPKPEPEPDNAFEDQDGGILRVIDTDDDNFADQIAEARRARDLEPPGRLNVLVVEVKARSLSAWKRGELEDHGMTVTDDESLERMAERILAAGGPQTARAQSIRGELRPKGWYPGRRPPQQIVLGHRLGPSHANVEALRAGAQQMLGEPVFRAGRGCCGRTNEHLIHFVRSTMMFHGVLQFQLGANRVGQLSVEPGSLVVLVCSDTGHTVWLDFDGLVHWYRCLLLAGYPGSYVLGLRLDAHGTPNTLMYRRGAQWVPLCPVP